MSLSQGWQHPVMSRRTAVQAGAIGLLGDLPCLDRERDVVDLRFYGVGRGISDLQRWEFGMNGDGAIGTGDRPAYRAARTSARRLAPRASG